MGSDLIKSSRLFGGEQQIRRHRSAVLSCEMTFAVYLPPAALSGGDCPVLLYLSGLTCTEQNVTAKAGAQRYCAEHGLILLAPDTSPRGEDVADDDGWDLGKGAGFYLTATQAPWSAHYRMDQYILTELIPELSAFTKSQRIGVTGHSMGGHGAIVLALRSPGVFSSVSALAPILQPSTVPWGIKAFTTYLGPDPSSWAEWDSTALIPGASERLPILIDQGDADGFLAEQLHSDRFLAACAAAEHPVTYRLQPGYDHSYDFVATFIGEHVAWHAAALR
ncbi:MAG: S-formylglutathione hydrolase [Myxococcota bacterium]|jgi:S-formylglutathione hydrolase